jgi:hypothetical protein
VGAQFEYANAGFAVLGMIVKQLSNEPYAAYLQRHILEPLQMRHAYLSLNDAKRNGMAAGFRYWFGFPAAYEMPYRSHCQSEGGIISTAEDMTHYLGMYLNHGEYAGQQAALYHGDPGDGAARHKVTQTTQGETVSFDYGMGWAVGDLNGVPTIFHTGGAPHFTSWMFLIPHSNQAVIVLTNAGNYLPTGSGLDAFGNPIAVTSLLAGRPLKWEGMSIHRLYLIIDAVVCVVLGFQTLSLVLLRRHLSVAMRPVGLWQSTVQVWHTAIPLLWAFDAALFALVTVPSLLYGYNWRWAIAFTPTWRPRCWRAMSGLCLLTGAVRVLKTVQALMHGRSTAGVRIDLRAEPR